MNEFVLIVFLLIGGEVEPIGAAGTFTSFEECNTEAERLITVLDENREEAEQHLAAVGADGFGFDCFNPHAHLEQAM